mmetsp:Transcript_25857/g.38882  ORF Transcript_25857/g.38882 Transcript_25857/m.38882 type:complete len:84 (+) Transcript_25857:174-425(+)
MQQMQQQMQTMQQQMQQTKQVNQQQTQLLSKLMEQIKPIRGSASGRLTAAAAAPAPQAMMGMASGFILPADYRATFNPTDLAG